MMRAQRVLMDLAETTSMFKKLVPVIALALIAGPVFAADTPPSKPSSDQSSSTPAKPHQKKHKKPSAARQPAEYKSGNSSSTAPAK